jgi:hypothetical protein
MRVGSPVVSSGCDREALSRNKQVLNAKEPSQHVWHRPCECSVPKCSQRLVCVARHFQTHGIALTLHGSRGQKDAQSELQLGHVSCKLELAAFPEWPSDGCMEQEGIDDEADDGKDPRGKERHE